jgi:mRNA interferase MazF
MDSMAELHRGDVLWVDFDPVRGREQSGRRPAVVVASKEFLSKADTLAIVIPATSSNREWPNHVLLRGSGLLLTQPTYAMTEQPKTITRDRIVGTAGTVSQSTMDEIDIWLRDFLQLH